MAKTLVDIDEDWLRQAQEVLETRTKRDTVNEALHQVVAQAARRRDVERLRSGALPDLADPLVSASAWRQ